MSTLAAIAWAPLGVGPWHPPASPPRATLPRRADCVVIGAGVTGLRCAIGLADAGCDVVVLDRAFGRGAACRSGGIVVGDTLVGPAPGFDGCERDLRDWIERGHVDVGLRWCGCLEMDRDAALSPSPVNWQDSGAVRIARAVSGGTLDPAALVAALAAEAVARGARFVDDVNVTGLVSDGEAVQVQIEGGRQTLVARRALVAVDAVSHATPFDPWPIRLLTVALETPPLDDAAFDAMGWSGRQPFYTNELPLLWGRVLPAGGILFGRELLSADGLTDHRLARAVADAGTRLTSRVRALHAALATVTPVRVWAGPIARDESGVPGLHVDPAVAGVMWAGGYGGHGLAPAFRLGAIAARALMSS